MPAYLPFTGVILVGKVAEMLTAESYCALILLLDMTNKVQKKIPKQSGAV
jgi:hypothetical protein